MVRRFAFALALCLASVLPTSAAPILEINANNILTGATGVNVGGTLYDVEFVEGSCVSLFTGCNEVTDFAFTTQATAIAAADALLAQVFVNVAAGNFDSDHKLTFGCSANLFCDAITPYSLTANDTAVRVTVARNSPSFDESTFGAPFVISDSTSSFATVYVRWTPASAPEPASMTLLGLGLAGLGARRWRQRRNR